MYWRRVTGAGVNGLWDAITEQSIEDAEMHTQSGIAELHNYQVTESEGGGSISGDGEVGTGISRLGSPGGLVGRVQGGEG